MKRYYIGLMFVGMGIGGMAPQNLGGYISAALLIIGVIILAWPFMPPSTKYKDDIAKNVAKAMEKIQQ